MSIITISNRQPGSTPPVIVALDNGILEIIQADWTFRLTLEQARDLAAVIPILLAQEGAKCA
jgi:hypothetical protein